MKATVQLLFALGAAVYLVCVAGWQVWIIYELIALASIGCQSLASSER